jgi:hypothetical protein
MTRASFSVSAVLFLLALLAIVPADAMAQRGLGQMDINTLIDREMAELQERVELNELQHMLVREVLLERRQAMRQVVMQAMQSNGSNRDRMEIIRKHEEETFTAIEELLEEEQKPAFRSWVADRQERTNRQGQRRN